MYRQFRKSQFQFSVKNSYLILIFSEILESKGIFLKLKLNDLGMRVMHL